MAFDYSDMDNKLASAMKASHISKQRDHVDEIDSTFVLASMQRKLAPNEDSYTEDDETDGGDDPQDKASIGSDGVTKAAEKERKLGRKAFKEKEYNAAINEK